MPRLKKPGVSPASFVKALDIENIWPLLLVVDFRGGILQNSIVNWARALACASVTVLSACTTDANVTNQANGSFAATPSKAGMGVIYIGRPMTFRTSVFAVPLEVDGKPLVSLGPNQYARVELPPGHHEISAADNGWSRAINGVPHPVSLKVEAGMAYYLLPTRWAGAERTTIAMVNTMAIPEQTRDPHSSFSVQVSTPGAAPPPVFRQLSPAQ